MWFGLILWVGAIAMALLAGWWIRRYQRDIDDYYVREYREPPVFQWQGWL